MQNKKFRKRVEPDQKPKGPVSNALSTLHHGCHFEESSKPDYKMQPNAYLPMGALLAIFENINRYSSSTSTYLA